MDVPYRPSREAGARKARPCGPAAPGLLFQSLGIAMILLAAGMSAPNVSAEPGGPTYRIETLAEGLEYPWSLAQLPDGSLLVTEKPGRLLHLDADFAGRNLVEEVPEVMWVGQGGLLDVAPHPEYGQAGNHWVYLSYSKSCAAGFTTALSRYRLQDNRLEDGQLLFEAHPCGGLTWHFGGRLAFDEEGYLFLTVGDRGERENAQRLDSHWGKLIRLHADGRIPVDNPFAGEPDALPEVYSYGHRNPQGLARNPFDAKLWLHEHGPKGGDELNRIRAGANYGWPRVTHGREYTGGIISEQTQAPGMEPPVRHWTPSIAPSGLAVYDGDPFAEWRGHFLVGALKFRSVYRVQLEAGGAVQEQVLPEPRDHRIRDVRVLADGLVYLLTDDSDGKLLRLVPSGLMSGGPGP